MKKPSSRIFDLAIVTGVCSSLIIGEFMEMTNLHFAALCGAMSGISYLFFRTIWEVNDSRKSDKTNSNFQYDKKLEDK